MALDLYDEALLSKLSNWTKDTSIHIVGVNDTKRLFEVISDETNDKNIKLPLIALSRSGGYSILNRSKRPLSYDSSLVKLTAQNGTRLSAIPISIQYQLDIYARYLKEADEYARNIVFNIINYPKLQIEIPYEDIRYLHDSNIRIISDVEDNSDIPERLVPGQFTRLTIGISIDDAYLFDVRVKDNISIVDGSLTIGIDQNDTK